MISGVSAPKGIRLTQKQRIAWLRLIRSDNVGPATFRDLINNFGSADKALEMLPELSRRGGSSKSIRVATIAEAEQEMEFAEKFGAVFIGIGEPEYPNALRQIDGAPPLLAAIGNISQTTNPSVAIVGSRNASITGTKITKGLATELSRAGYTVTSGLARGIDAAAHHACKGQICSTIAVLAGGLDHPYPPDNIPLYNELAAGAGLVVTEMKFGWKPIARDFPRRNRIIAGISLGLAVIEAATRSGSLISARRAADFGRLVFAVPGSPLDPRSKGTNDLLKNGAIVTTSSQDVIDALAPISQLDLFNHPVAEESNEEPNHTIEPPNDNVRAIIINAMGTSPVAIDDIIQHTNLPTQTVYLVLLELELAGKLQRQTSGSGGLVTFVPDL